MTKVIHNGKSMFFQYGVQYGTDICVQIYGVKVKRRQEKKSLDISAYV